MQRLLAGGAYFSVDTQKCGAFRGRRLFEARRLLEEIRYQGRFILKVNSVVLYKKNLFDKIICLFKNFTNFSPLCQSSQNVF